MGNSKPKKAEFQKFISEWVYELKQLELGFYICPPNYNETFVKVHAFLMAAALDKKSVPKGKGSTRLFIRDKENNIKDRNILNLSRRKLPLKTNAVDLACGQRGSYILRELTYFDLGQSLTSDSLHNVYSGTFKRLLEIWFTTASKSYSIKKSLNLIEAKLDSMRYPTTTYHLPSQLRHFQTFKEKEFRLVLLFSYQYFQPFLPARCYQHLKLLAFAMALSESSVIFDDTIDTIRDLLDEFDRSFSSLYLASIHIRSITQSINGPNLIISELINNLNIVQSATNELNNINLNRSLKLYVFRIFSTKRQALPSEKSLDENFSIRFARKLDLQNSSITFKNVTIYQTFCKNHIQFSTYDLLSTTKNSDSCLLFKHQQQQFSCGSFFAIIRESVDDYRLIIHTVDITNHDSLKLKNKQIMNPFIFWGKLTNPHRLVTIHAQDIITKLAYNKIGDVFQFFRYPNIVEST
ncbi:unnamed protein product [Adineta ricciae]|uniref:Uncharacterized protein n=1 Tax=Adineta ricciae TaxID=249248 RepID=A0A815LTE7_ADIRI|nr:unnamed protein product [Adineta ricciae]CAF1519742.1 unnamed protein product [Adineta ricciae]